MDRIKLISILLLIMLLSSTNPIKAYEINGFFTLSNSEIIPFDTYEGKYVLIDAMATWCGPCRVEMLHLQEIYEVVKDESKLQMISISMDPESDDLTKLKSFMEEFDAEWEYGLDHNLDLLTHFEVIGYPTTIFLDQNGTVIEKWLGITNADVILSTMDKYLELPGAFAREIQLNALINNLLNNQFFFIFLMAVWAFIIYSGFKFIQKLKPSQKSTENEVDLYQNR